MSPDRGSLTRPAASLPRLRPGRGHTFEALRTRVPALPTWSLVAGLVALQWTVLAAVALSVDHNGWLYYQGGDQTWHYTSAWLLAGGAMPYSLVGYVWPALLAPIAEAAGPTVLDALPAIVLLQTVFLVPVAVACCYGIGSFLGGRPIGFLAGAGWAVLPAAAIPLFDERYHERYVDQFLPQMLGLTAMSDFPSMVALLVAAYFVLRAASSGGSPDALVAGLAAGVALGTKPSNLLFVPAPLLALALARRPRELAVFAVGLAPALVTLAIWKDAGLGYIPALAQPAVRLAASDVLVGALPDGVGRYIDLDWSQLAANEDGLREYFFSVRVLEWLVLAGTIATARRSIPAAALLFAWLASFVLVKGMSPQVAVEDGSFFRFVLPALPAFVVLVSALPLLVPRVGARLAAASTRATPFPRRSLSAIAALLVVIALGPLLAITLTSPVADARAAVHEARSLYWPVSDALALRAEPVGARVKLAWKRPETATTVFFHVFRAHRDDGLECAPEAPGVYCRFRMERIQVTRATTYLADDPAGEGWVYRVGLAANAADDPAQGDVLLLSPPVQPR